MFEFDFDGVKNCSVIAALPTNKDKSILSKPKHTKKRTATTKSMFSLHKEINIKPMPFARANQLRSN